MSAIGDYVHYTLKGYRDGKSPEGFTETSLSQASAAIKQMHEILKNQIEESGNKKIEKELQEKYNIIYRLIMGTDKTKKKTSADEQKIANAIMTVFGDAITDTMTVSFQNGRPVFTKTVQEGTATKNRGRKIAENVKDSETKLNTFLDSVTKLKNKADVVLSLKKDNVSMEELDTITKDTQKLGQILRRINDFINSGEIQKDDSLGKLFNTPLIKKRSQISIEGGKKTLPTLSQLIEEYNGIRERLSNYNLGGNAANLIGLLGENMEKIYAQYIGKQSETEVVGTDTFVRTISTEFEHNFLEKQKANTIGAVTARLSDISSSNDDKKKEKIIKTLYSENDKNNSIKIATTQGKIDVYYKLSKDNVAATSFKMYDLEFALKSGVSQGIGLVGGSPFLYLVQNYNENNFVTHWMNLTYGIQEDRNDLEKNRHQAHIRMKQVLFFAAMTGKNLSGFAKNDNLKRIEGADYFIIGDSKGKGIKVFAISTILTKLLLDKEGANIDNNVDFGDYKDIFETEGTLWTNPKVWEESHKDSSPAKRIEDMRQFLRNIPITIHLKSIQYIINNLQARS